MAEYFERDALLQDIEDSVRITSKTGMINPETRVAYKIIERIKSAAAADVAQVRHGLWKRTTDGAALCTACKRKMNPSQYGYAFCGLYGAKMDLHDECK